MIFIQKRKALLSIVLAKSNIINDYGHVTLDKSQNLISFNEKMEDNKLIDNKLIGESLINAGIYIMQEEIFSYMPEQDNFSLEKDLFPKIINDKNTKSRCFGFLANSKVLDIGTPERYKIAIDNLL